MQMKCLLSFSRYHDFQTLQIKTAKQYPFLVEGELKRYAESVCSYFGVTLDKPKKAREELKDNEGMLLKKFLDSSHVN